MGSRLTILILCFTGLILTENAWASKCSPYQLKRKYDEVHQTRSFTGEDSLVLILQGQTCMNCLVVIPYLMNLLDKLEGEGSSIEFRISVCIEDSLMRKALIDRLISGMPELVNHLENEGHYCEYKEGFYWTPEDEWFGVKEYNPLKTKLTDYCHAKNE